MIVDMQNRPGPCRVFDADGKELERVIECDTETGRVVQFACGDRHSGIITRVAPSPLRVELEMTNAPIHKLRNIKRIESADGVPVGHYAGTWSGYTVRFETPFGRYEADSLLGAHGVDVPCVVTHTSDGYEVTATDE